MRPSVLMIGSEAVPFAKTGGLADVLGALPPALGRVGWDVTVALPRYRGVSAGTLVERVPVSVGGYTREVGLYDASMDDGARALLVECADLYDRDSLYGSGGEEYPDNARRFAVLVRAALDYVARRGVRPAVIHAHDWQAGLAPIYLTTLFASHPVLGGVPSVFTIHNIAYQGVFESDWLPRLDLGWTELAVDRMEFWGRISFLKGAINASTIVTTVSRRYAEEIQTEQFGSGLDGVLRLRRSRLVGIPNGIDTSVWDPANDRFLPVPYSVERLDAKTTAKRALLARYGLPADEDAVARPLVGMISRMVDQKGFDLIAGIADQLPGLGATFVVLGTGESRYQDLWEELAARNPSRVAAYIGFEESLAHLIEGGADIFLMPSLFEPCGLNQMYSLRYGTVPVVRAVGGLADTVDDYTPGNPRSTGFVFREYTGEALLGALRRALDLFRDRPAWRALQTAGMRRDNSWDHSAGEYVRIYGQAMDTIRG
jgi:starch synthase